MNILLLSLLLTMQAVSPPATYQKTIKPVNKSVAKPPVEPTESDKVAYDHAIMISLEGNLRLIQQQMGISNAESKPLITPQVQQLYQSALKSYNVAAGWLDQYHNARILGVNPHRTEDGFHRAMVQAVYDVAVMVSTKGK